MKSSVGQFKELSDRIKRKKQEEAQKNSEIYKMAKENLKTQNGIKKEDEAGFLLGFLVGYSTKERENK